MSWNVMLYGNTDVNCQNIKDAFWNMYMMCICTIIALCSLWFSPHKSFERSFIRVCVCVCVWVCLFRPFWIIPGLNQRLLPCSLNPFCLCWHAVKFLGGCCCPATVSQQNRLSTKYKHVDQTQTKHKSWFPPELKKIDKGCVIYYGSLSGCVQRPCWWWCITDYSGSAQHWRDTLAALQTAQCF